MRSRTGGHAEAVAWDSWPLRAREGVSRFYDDPEGCAGSIHHPEYSEVAYKA